MKFLEREMSNVHTASPMEVVKTEGILYLTLLNNDFFLPCLKCFSAQHVSAREKMKPQPKLIVTSIYKRKPVAGRRQCVRHITFLS